MDQSKPSGALKFRKKRITIMVGICPKCGKDMWKRNTFSKTIKTYKCMSCDYTHTVK